MLNFVFKFYAYRHLTFILRKKGLELRSTGSYNHYQSKILAFIPAYLFFLGEEGVLLTVYLQLRAKRSQAHRATVANVLKLNLPLLRLCLATAKQTLPKPSLTPLHVRGCCTMRRFKFSAIVPRIQI